jgi:putative membrane protein
MWESTFVTRRLAKAAEAAEMDTPPPADDPRVRFAAERTLLAWIRTGLALMGFGFVVARFGLFLRELTPPRPDAAAPRGFASLWLGTALVVLGVAVTLYAAADHWRVIGQLERGERLSRSWSGLALAGLLAALGLFVVAHLTILSHGL